MRSPDDNEPGHELTGPHPSRMDPVRNMMMRNNDNASQSGSNNNIITVEEGMDCRQAGSRFFSLQNHESNLDVIVSKTSTITSCKLGGHEIIVGQHQYRQHHETWALGDRPYQKLSALPWNCHVRGVALLLSATNNTSSMLYELSRLNELSSVVKLKTIHLQSQATYFNLNNAREKVPIDGHTLVVQCNGNMDRIQVQNTKLLCQCNKSASILPQSLVGEIPFELVRHDAQSNPDGSSVANISDDDLIVCDSVFSIDSTCSLDFLRVKLQYNERAVVFEVRSTNWPTSIASPNQNQRQHADVTSSTNKNAPTSFQDLFERTQQAASSSSTDPQVTSDGATLSGAGDISQCKDLISSLVDVPSTSCQSSKSKNHTTKSASATSHPNTCLRARVRVTNFGVCIMPIMMTNYSCTYKFIW